MPEAEALARARRACVTAAAGCGKTQLISEAIAKHGEGRQLVLTHTHAGVDALRSRLKALSAKSGSFAIDTLAGWALRYATAFPKTSSVASAKPGNKAEWDAVYEGAAKALAVPAIRKVLAASYGGIYVDEYQDCTVQQHKLVTTFSSIIPTRVLGDPLQGIFDFGDNTPVSWARDVAGTFESLPGPTAPRRWAGKNEQLGAWLNTIRAALLSGARFDLRGPTVTFVQLTEGPSPLQAVGICLEAARKLEGSIVAIHKLPQQCHWVANKLKGIYSCVEPIESDDLLKFAESLEDAGGHARAAAAIDFAAKCMTAAGPALKSARAALAKGGMPKGRKIELARPLAALGRVADSGSLVAVAEALEAMADIPGAAIYRRELLDEGLRALRDHDPAEHASIKDAIWLVRNRTRQRGRRLARCTVGRTLLIKGLEFDHVIILAADGLQPKDLYVALTRGTRSLTILARSPVKQFPAILS